MLSPLRRDHTAKIKEPLPPIRGFPSGASLVAQMVKNPFVMEETQVQSLGGEDSLEKGMATHSSFLAWEIPWIDKPDQLHTVHSVPKNCM